MKNNGSKLVVIASDWGHIGTLNTYLLTRTNVPYDIAGGPLNNDDIDFVNDQVRQFFGSDL